MAGNLIPKKTLATRADGSTYETTVYVNLGDDAVTDFKIVNGGIPSSATSERPGSAITDPSDLKSWNVTETTIRGYAALSVSFPDLPDRGFHMIHDTEEQYGEQIILIDEVRPDATANVDSYVQYGQGGYGSEGIMQWNGVLVKARYDGGVPVPLIDLTEQEPDMTPEQVEDAISGNMFDHLYYASDGRPVSDHIIYNIIGDDLVTNWLHKHAPEYLTV